MNVHRFCLFILSFLFALQNCNAQTWQLSNPTDGAPGFMPGYGENIYVSGENDPGLRLTRTATAVRPTVVLSDTTYPGQSKKNSPVIVKANDGSSLVIWYNTKYNNNLHWWAQKIDANGKPQGDNILLPDIMAQHSWREDKTWSVASNGEQIVFVWESGEDIVYQLYNCNGFPLTAMKQANQDTILNVPGYGDWEPGAFNPTVNMLNNGSFIIAWQDERNAELIFDYDYRYMGRDTGEIYARCFDATGEPQDNNFLLNQDSFPWVQSFPAICMNDSGTIFCCWIENDTTRKKITPDLVRGRIIGKNFSKDFVANGFNHSYSHPVVASSSTGFAALWQEDDESLFVQAIDNNGQNVGIPKKVFNTEVLNYNIRTLENHQYVIIWNKKDSPIIQGCIFNPADGTLRNIQNFIVEESIVTEMMMDNKGTAIAYLSENNSSVNAVLLNDNMEPQHLVKRLNSDKGGAEHKKPVGVKLTNGKYLTAWLDARSGVTQIFGQFFDAAGEMTGGNFPIATLDDFYWDDEQSFTLVAHPQEGAIIMYKGRTNNGASHSALMQYISSEGELQPAIQINETKNDYSRFLKINIMPTYPFTILASWSQNGMLYGKLYNSDLNELSNAQALKDISYYYYYNTFTDPDNRFWLIGIDYITYDESLYGFDSNLHQIFGPTQFIDSTNTNSSYGIPQLVILTNGKMLAVWLQRSSWKSSEVICGQLFDNKGIKIGNNFNISNRLVKNAINKSIIGYNCTATDSLFVISWSAGVHSTVADEIGIVWLDQNGKMVNSATCQTNINFFTNHLFFPLNNNRLLFIHEAIKAPNPIDIAVDIFESSIMNTNGWYNSPVFLNEDTLTWKKLSWLDDAPENTSVKVFFRCKDNLWNEDDKYIPWQQIENGQTENLPAGKRAQWRVELTGTESVSPIVYDLIGEYERKTGIEKTTDAVPYSYRLDPVYPNPANSRVTIAYELAAPAKTTIAIYNILGQRINQWQLTQQPAGRHTWHWNGETGLGARAASGLYFITLEANSFRATRKVVLMQ
ncbi:MAG TPA: T9SS type A sorting domain-containing protein [bacterium]|nr:T9SS type A sorting domain-containing protein [bacterium]HPN44018.1 T9SS type A sorting domain-containing protein [bacterium]